MKLTAKAAAIILLAGLLQGCAGSLKIGTVPPVDRLSSLSVSQSDMDDVRATLGAPQGQGQARMPDYPGLRTTWSYEYTEVEGERVGLSLLIVFFDGELYDGYLWFDTTETLKLQS